MERCCQWCVDLIGAPDRASVVATLRKLSHVKVATALPISTCHVELGIADRPGCPQQAIGLAEL